MKSAKIGFIKGIHMEYLPIALRASTVYLFILLAIRLMGKSEMSQLSVSDLVFIMLLSNAVQNAMVGSDTSLMGGLVAAGALFVLNRLFKELLYRFPRFRKAVQGDSLLLIYKGQVQDANLHKARLRMDDLLEALREHGVEEIAKVDLAVLEVDGNISVLTEDFTKRSQHKVKNNHPQKQGETIGNKRDRSKKHLQ